MKKASNIACVNMDMVAIIKELIQVQIRLDFLHLNKDRFPAIKKTVVLTDSTFVLFRNKDSWIIEMNWNGGGVEKEIDMYTWTASVKKKGGLRCLDSIYECLNSSKITTADLLLIYNMNKI